MSDVMLPAILIALVLIIFRLDSLHDTAKKIAALLDEQNDILAGEEEVTEGDEWKHQPEEDK